MALAMILIAIVGLLPAAAQTQESAQEQQGQATGSGTGSIEVHLAECPPGFDESAGGNYFDDCHSTASENVEIALTSNAGVDETRTSEQVEENGPGVGFFGELAAGDYTVAVDWPVVPTDTYWSYCSEADSDLEVAVTPDDASTGQVTLADGQQIVCDWYLAHDPSAISTIELSAFECAADAMTPTDNPATTDFETACTELATEIDFHLIDTATDADTVQTTDDEGTATFAFDGTAEIEFYADVPLEANEWMFCATNEEEPEFVEFDQEGVTTFESGEQRTLVCSWFRIEEALTADAPPATAPATEIPVEPSANEQDEAEVPADSEGGAQGPTTEPSASIGQIAISPIGCPQGYDTAAEGLDYEAFAANCVEPLADVSFNLTDGNGIVDTRISDEQDAITYASLPSGTYTLYSDIPLEAATEYLFCTADGGNRYQKEFNETGVTTYAGLQREQIACEWFVVPTSLRGEENGGSLEVHLAACPLEYTGSRLYDDCHGNGVADQQFTLTSTGGEQTGTTTVPQTPGPGTVTFTNLGAGDYTLQGGPPGDFGAVKLFCNVQPADEAVAVTVDSATATFAIGENQDVLCDWYYIPEDARGPIPPTATSTPEASRADILVTLYSCPPASDDSGTYGGATRQDYQDACTETVNDVPFALGDIGAPPLRANTGASGDGAVRFYDLLAADYTMEPSLPDELSSSAIFCTIGDGDPYQKALQNGAATFVDVDGDNISCDWYAVEARQTQPAGPSGSITVREYLCEADRSEITDWETQCAPGASGSSFTLTPSGDASSLDGTADANGIHVFRGLNDGFYELTQNDGIWCRAVADRVDSQSRVIVQDGGNTDVVLYQCAAVAGLPTTGTGPGGTVTAGEESGIDRMEMVALALVLLAAPIAILGFVQSRKRRKIASEERIETVLGPIITASGTTWMRFK